MERSRYWNVKKTLVLRIFNYTKDHEAQGLIAEFGERMGSALSALQTGEAHTVQALSDFMKAVDAPLFAFDDTDHHEMMVLNEGQPQAICRLNILERMNGNDCAWQDAAP